MPLTDNFYPDTETGFGIDPNSQEAIDAWIKDKAEEEDKIRQAQLALDFARAKQAGIPPEPPPPPPVDPNRRYIDQQLRLAELIRERGTREADPALIAQRVAAAGMAPLQPGETLPQGLREQNPDEIALRQDIANQQQAGTFGPPPQPPMPRFYNPTTQSSRTGNNGANGIVNFGNSLLNQRGANPHQVFDLMRQMQAQDAYRKTFAETRDRNLAMQAAEPFLVGTPAGNALLRASQPPPGPPQGFTLPGGAQGAYVPGTTRFGFVPKNTFGTPQSDTTKTALQKNAESILEADAEAKAAFARGDMEAANIALKRGALIERQLKNQVNDALEQEVKWNNAEITGWIKQINALQEAGDWEKSNGTQVTNLLKQIELKKNEIRGQLKTPSDSSTPKTSEPEFESTAVARKNGHKSGDVIILKGVGRVRLN